MSFRSLAICRTYARPPSIETAPQRQVCRSCSFLLSRKVPYFRHRARLKRIFGIGKHVRKWAHSLSSENVLLYRTRFCQVYALHNLRRFAWQSLIRCYNNNTRPGKCPATLRADHLWRAFRGSCSNFGFYGSATWICKELPDFPEALISFGIRLSTDKYNFDRMAIIFYIVMLVSWNSLSMPVL